MPLFILFSILSHNFSSHWNFCRILSISEYSNQWYQFYGILMNCFYFTIKYNYMGLYYLGFPGSTSGKEPAWQCRRQKRRKFNSWRRKWQPIPIFLPGESHGQRSLVVTVHKVAKSRTQLKWLNTATYLSRNRFMRNMFSFSLPRQIFMKLRKKWRK